MLNPDEDTEWNEILRERGILPPKKPPPVEEEPPPSPSLEDKLNGLDNDQLEAQLDRMLDDGDDDDAKFLESYRRKRLALLRQEAARAKFGQVRPITKADWKTEVNEADDVFIVIHISQRGHELCNLVDAHLTELARKFPMVKFLRGEASLCIPNYPERNLPSLLIYNKGDVAHQLIGPSAIGGKAVTAKNLEWRLAQLGVLKTDLLEDPSKRIHVHTNQRGVNRIGRHHSGSDEESD